ncbi:TonB-dependent receptor [Coraliomargarita algicola]|uniref:TonB-dependent receptor n=1 Tax=Coraliomargarita algicola TaxID=3092156 RepID=A0ABZ0RIA3_9BACT|nr:TonB-dependent receptor [Coraliomargarita sp. J2-16]WPJ94520.1 TonB-dependent receptor [Coraliomargarita sp. J2-16]
MLRSESGLIEWYEGEAWAAWNPDDAVNLLEYFPNITINELNPGSDESLISIRDNSQLANGRTWVLLDGFPLSNLVNAGAQGASRLNVVDPQSISSVEVLYGSYSAEYGGYALGGVVSYETKPIEERSARFAVRYMQQDFDLYGTSESLLGYRAEVLLQERIDKWGIAISASRFENEGQPDRYLQTTNIRTTPPPPTSTLVKGAYVDSDPEGEARMTYGSAGVSTTIQDNFGIKATYDLSAHTTLRFTSRYSSRDTDLDAVENYLRDASGDPIWGGNVTQDGKTVMLSSRAFGEQKLVRDEILNGIGVRGELPSDWKYDLVLSAFHTLDERRLRSNQNSADPSYDGSGSVTETPHKYWLYGKAKVMRDDFLGHASLAFLAGYEWNQAGFEDREYASTDWKQGDHAALSSKRGGETELHSAFGELSWQIGPSLQLTGGLRVDDWSASDGFSESPSARNDFDGRSVTEWSPKLSLHIQIDDTNSLQLNAARAYRFPLVLELFQTTRDELTDEIILSNPELAPERSDSVELSWIREIEHGNVRGTVFYNEVSDAILSQFIEAMPPPPGPPPPGGAPPPPSSRSYNNIDRVETIGVELSIQRRHLFIRELSGAFSLSYMDSKIRDYAADPTVVGNRYPGVPEWRASGNLRYRIHPSLEAALGARYQSHVFERIDNADTRDTIQTISEQLVFDLSMRYRIMDGLNLNARIDNLLNEVYFTNRPERQRSFTVGLDYRF